MHSLNTTHKRDISHIKILVVQLNSPNFKIQLCMHKFLLLYLSVFDSQKKKKF